MPGPHKCEALAEGFKLRAQEVIDIKVLESQISPLDKVWAMVSSQKKTWLSVTARCLLIVVDCFEIDVS